MRAALNSLLLLMMAGSTAAMGQEAGDHLQLPQPNRSGDLSVEEALQMRRSVREYSIQALLLDDVAQILWAAQGISSSEGYRTAPSAGGLFPLEVYLVSGRVEDLPDGVYHYLPGTHELVLTQAGDPRKRLASAAYGQSWVRKAPAVLVITAVYQRSEAKYGSRGQRYAHMEAGHVAQNVYLQAEARGLATVYVGAFAEAEVREILALPPGHVPIGLMPLGRER